MRKIQCYLCGSKKLEVVRTKLRHDITRRVMRCSACSLVYLEPKKRDLKNYYLQNYRKLYTPVIEKKLSSEEIFEINLPYQERRIKELRNILNPKIRVLDIGCSSGFFLYALKNYVRECIGIEFNLEDANFVNKKLKIKTYSTNIESTDIPFEYFDLITMFEVLEHIDDPLRFLGIAANYLKPDGFICVEVPNINEALLAIYDVKPYADFFYREPHIFYYSPKTISLLFKKAGFKGQIKTIQGYNFINHMHWILTGKPQPAFNIGMSTPALVTSNTVKREIKSEFNRWIVKVNNEYTNMLNRHELGECILFIGQKA